MARSLTYLSDIAGVKNTILLSRCFQLLFPHIVNVTANSDISSNTHDTVFCDVAHKFDVRRNESSGNHEIV